MVLFLFIMFILEKMPLLIWILKITEKPYEAGIGKKFDLINSLVVRQRMFGGEYKMASQFIRFT